MDIGRLHSITLLVFRLATIWSTLPPPSKAPPPILQLSAAVANYGTIQRAIHLLTSPRQITHRNIDSGQGNTSNDAQKDKISGGHDNVGALNEATVNKKLPGGKLTQVLHQNLLENTVHEENSRRKRSGDEYGGEETNFMVADEGTVISINPKELDSAQDLPLNDVTDKHLPDYKDDYSVNDNIAGYDIFYDSSVLNNSIVIANNSLANGTDVFVLSTGKQRNEYMKVAVLSTVLSLLLLATCKMSLQMFAKYAVRDKTNE